MGLGRAARKAGVASAILVLVAACGQSPDPWLASQRDGETQATSHPAKAEGTTQSARQVLDDLPIALKNFDGSFPEHDQKAVLAALRADFTRDHRNGLAENPGERISYEAGYAEAVIVTHWMCSWEGAYVHALERDDTAGVARADAQLAQWYDLEYAKRVVSDPERAWEKDVCSRHDAE